jgi:hypothetical protein
MRRNTEQHASVRGARDLTLLWRTLPVAALQYNIPAWQDGLGVADLNNMLRDRAWRQHCANVSPRSCADLRKSCLMNDGDRCKADTLFPVNIGGGAKSWRMATLFLHWRPSIDALQLVTLGKTTCEQIDWAADCLKARYSLHPASRLDVTTLADLELCQAERWRLLFVTPWVVNKNVRTVPHAPDNDTVMRELAKSLRQRAHKLTALCTSDSIWQRLGGHLVHHVADSLLPSGSAVERVDIKQATLQLASTGNGAAFDALVWQGEVTLRIDAQLLPWLTLLAICGGGENADKGFGSVELIPL